MNAPLPNIKDWSEKHEIGRGDCRIIERAIQYYLSAAREFDAPLGYVSEIRDLRDQIIACHSIRIIPDEDQ